MISLWLEWDQKCSGDELGAGCGDSGGDCKTTQNSETLINCLVLILLKKMVMWKKPKNIGLDKFPEGTLILNIITS